MPIHARPLRVAILTSREAPGLAELIANGNRGVVFDICGVISTEPLFTEQPETEAAGIPLVMRPLKQYGDEHGLSLRNLRQRESYDLETAEILQTMSADYVFLVGYNYLLTEPFLSAFANKAIALHDGDLTLRDAEGRRRFAGLHAVREALIEGQRETRSCAYFLTREAAAGPLFLLSAAFPVSPLVRSAEAWGDFDMLARYADLHRRWMRRAAWGEMLVRGIEFLAAGRLQVIRDMVWIDGVPGPCRMGEAPAVCRDVEHRIDGGIPASCPLIHGTDGKSV